MTEPSQKAPKSARKRHLAARLAAGDTPLKRHGQSATSEPKGLRTESRKRDERTHCRAGSRIENATNEPTAGWGRESKTRRTNPPANVTQVGRLRLGQSSGLSGTDQNIGATCERLVRANIVALDPIVLFPAPI